MNRDRDLLLHFLEHNEGDPYGTTTHTLMRTLQWALQQGAMSEDEELTLLDIRNAIVKVDPHVSINPTPITIPPHKQAVMRVIGSDSMTREEIRHELIGRGWIRKGLKGAPPVDSAIESLIREGKLIRLDRGRYQRSTDA